MRGHKGNRTWLVELPADVRSATRKRPEGDRTSPVALDGSDRLEASRSALARIEELLRADGELRAALADERVARARTEAEAAVLREALAREADHAGRERARADRLEAALVEARRPWLARLFEAVRRK